MVRLQAGHVPDFSNHISVVCWNAPRDEHCPAVPGKLAESYELPLFQVLSHHQVFKQELAFNAHKMAVSFGTTIQIGVTNIPFCENRR